MPSLNMRMHHDDTMILNPLAEEGDDSCSSHSSSSRRRPFFLLSKKDREQPSPIGVSPLLGDTDTNTSMPTTASAAACCGDGGGATAAWMEWVEAGVDLFGCTPGTGETIGRALLLQAAAPPLNPLLPEVDPQIDFVQLHNDFYQSILNEQQQRSSTSSGDTASTVTTDASLPSLGLEDASMSGSVSSGVSSTSSLTHDMDTLSNCSSTKTKRRRRPTVRFHRLSPKRRVSPLELYEETYAPKQNAHDLPPPTDYLHPLCKLQKDKGKGEALGSTSSAEGREACLEKLREKMSLVAQVAGETPGMKIRPAILSKRLAGRVETRSMIEMRLGFLSMQYGLLLHWNPQGKVIFMVLRKMCPDAFYKKVDVLPPMATARRAVSKRPEATPRVLRHVKLGDEAIYSRRACTEVVLVDPPYKIPRPTVLEPSVLTVTVQSVTGLSKKSRWTLSMTFDGHTESALLHYNPTMKRLDVQRAPCIWSRNPLDRVQSPTLELRLFEQRKRKHSYSKLYAIRTLPLQGIMAQPASAVSQKWQLEVPLKRSMLTLTLQHDSQYAHWLHKELDARQTDVGKDEDDYYVSSARSSQSRRRRYRERSQVDPWDCLCGMCIPAS